MLVNLKRLISLSEAPKWWWWTTPLPTERRRGVRARHPTVDLIVLDRNVGANRRFAPPRVDAGWSRRSRSGVGVAGERHRDVARLKNKVACRLHALLMELAPGGLRSEMTVNKAISLLEQVDVTDQVTRQRVVIASELIDDMGRLEAQMKVRRNGSGSLLSPRARPCVTFVGSDRSEPPSFWVRSATSPGSPPPGISPPTTPPPPSTASSGDRRRHRLNPRGNRKLNHVLHIAAVTQLRYPSEGRDYYQKKLAEGKTTKEAIRALKRRISNVVYRRLLADARRSIN